MSSLIGGQAALKVNYPFYGRTAIVSVNTVEKYRPRHPPPDMQLSSSDQHGVPVLRSGDTFKAMFQTIH